MVYVPAHQRRDGRSGKLVRIAAYARVKAKPSGRNVRARIAPKPRFALVDARIRTFARGRRRRG